MRDETSPMRKRGQKIETTPLSEWEDPMAVELEKLLIPNIKKATLTAMKKIVECGFTEEQAEWAVLNSGSYQGYFDIISNIFTGAWVVLTCSNKDGLDFSIPLLQKAHRAGTSTSTKGGKRRGGFITSTRMARSIDVTVSKPLISQPSSSGVKKNIGSGVVSVMTSKAAAIVKQESKPTVKASGSSAAPSSILSI
nr:putative E3 ubiquitin-protein ligase RF298 [Ipomoea trifida]